MKTILKIAAIFLILTSLAITVNAQEKSKHTFHKYGWHKSDTTFSSDSCHMTSYCCPMGYFDMDDFPFGKKKKKYNGHWAGFELGISGYLTPDFDMNFNPAYPYMNMNTARSITVNFNPFELNVNIYKNRIGFTTGLGFQTSNYYFNGNYVMLQDSSSLVAYKVQDEKGNYVTLKSNKMVVSYLNLPLLFEYQTNPRHNLKSFHVALGVIAGVRIGSYTKQVYNNKEETYFLVDDKGNKVATYDVENYMVRDRGAYHLSPFKLDAAFRVGWSRLNLFANYSLTQMFQKDQGPELYPLVVGITLLGW